MKIFTFVTILCLLVLNISASEAWEKTLDANLTSTLNNYSDNWDGGEAGSFNWAININGMAQKQFTEWILNKNSLKLSFGQNNRQDTETKDWFLPEKSTDLIDFETVFRFTLGAFVDPFASGRLESQFYDTRDNGNKRIFNPIKLTESAGVARVFIKDEHRELTSRLGLGIRQTIDRDVIIDADLDEKETSTTNDGGIEFVTEFNTPLANNQITYNSKLTVFKALFNSESDDLEGLPHGDYWKSPDVNWENIFTANITKYIMVNLYVQLLYDKEIDLKGRHKETLSVGLTYKLF